MSYWKIAGMSYLQYLTVATTALRNAVKSASASKYAPREEVHYKRQLWAEGKPLSERVLITVKPSDVGGKSAADAAAVAATSR